MPSSAIAFKVENSSMDPTHLDTEPKRSTLTLIVALLCALGITAALFGGYLYLRRRHAQNEMARQQAEG
jgi:cell division protein FtsB